MKRKARLNRVVDFACLGFASSVVMDAYLWVTAGYLVPSWTIAAMSLGLIVLLQVFKREVDLEVKSPFQHKKAQSLKLGKSPISPKMTQLITKHK
jgi:hypothetical protein